jgi:hypothetical protein
MVARKAALALGCLVMLVAVAADKGAEGKLTLTKDWRAQQFFLSAEPSELALTVTVTEGTLVIYTKDGRGNAKDLGESVPGTPLSVRGTYTTLFAKLPGEGTHAKGAYKLTFADAGDR